MNAFNISNAGEGIPQLSQDNCAGTSQAHFDMENIMLRFTPPIYDEGGIGIPANHLDNNIQVQYKSLKDGSLVTGGSGTVRCDTSNSYEP